MAQIKIKKNINIGNLIKYKNTNSSNAFTSIMVFYIYFIATIGMFFILPSEYRNTYVYYSGVILGTVLFASLAENSKSSFSFNIFWGLSFFILFFTLGFRKYSGIDDANYMLIFNNTCQYGWLNIFKTSTMEPGYLLLNALVSFFTRDYLYMQLVTSFIPLALFYYAFKKYKGMISLPMAVFLLSTMIYFLMISVALVRIFIAISIVFNAYYYIPKRNVKMYVFLIILAGTFHYSALLMLVLTYFVINKNNLSKKSRWFVVLFFVATPVVFVAVSKYLVPLMGGRYDEYGVIGNLKLGILGFDTVPILLLLFFYYKKINKEHADYYKLFLSIYTLSSIISFYSSMLSFGRLAFYTNSALFIAAPMVNKALKLNCRKNIFYGIIILYGFFYLYRTQFTVDMYLPHLFQYQNMFFTL